MEGTVALAVAAVEAGVGVEGEIEVVVLRKPVADAGEVEVVDAVLNGGVQNCSDGDKILCFISILTSPCRAAHICVAAFIIAKKARKHKTAWRTFKICDSISKI